jgi:hypothetical protein
VRPGNQAATFLVTLLALVAVGAPMTAHGAGNEGEKSATEVDAAAFAEIEAAYAAGDFDAASRAVDSLLVKVATLPSHQQAVVYLAKARLETAFGRPESARQWLVRADDADPRLTLDPVKDPPALRAAWADVRRQRVARHSVGDRSATVKSDEGAGGSGRGAEVSTTKLMLPLGGGHFAAGWARDGALFLTTELALGAAVTTAVPMRTRWATGAAVALGMWGYELLDRLPLLAATDRNWGGRVHDAVAIAPFGVGQVRNGSPGAAVVIAGTQLGLLVAAARADDERGRNVALGAFLAAWAAGSAEAVYSSPQGRPLISGERRSGRVRASLAVMSLSETLALGPSIALDLE